MPVTNLLYTLLIGPLEVLFEMIYVVTYNLIENPGLSIIGLSLVMNLLLLPLYKRTDAIQLEAIETEKRMKPLVTHIKKTFKGNEQFMMLQTCYRQNNYKPTDALKGLSPLMLEIPFFMAAYKFLSGLDLLQGASLGPIANLGAPDGLIVLGALTINVLPILMTVINVASCLIYTKDAPFKTKLQLYGMAALFLVLLYNSPAGLVFYWTLNNLFSLIKNALMKTKKPLRIVAAVSTAASIAAAIHLAVNAVSLGMSKSIQIGIVIVMLNIPLVMDLIRSKTAGKVRKPVVHTGKNTLSYFLSCLLLAVLMGALIPSALIHTSPEEFIIVGSGVNPLWYIVYNCLIWGGLFLIWMQLFYHLASPSGKRTMEFTMWGVCAAAITDYMFFGKSYGILSSQLTYESAMHNSTGIIVLNLAVLTAVIGILYLLWHKKPDILRIIAGAAAIAMAGMSGVNIVQSQAVLSDKMGQIEPPPAQVEPLFKLSRTGKNVVILMLDRGSSGFVPYLFNEKPILQEQFQGFTYYPNTLSFGSHTNIGLPAVFGGYEYTPLEINRRNQESLESKHNEALKMLPTLFHQNGYAATVCDPTYAGYDWIPDLSVFDDCPGVSTHITMGHYNDLEEAPTVDNAESMKHKFLIYSLFKASPVALHHYLYDSGSYHNIAQPAKQFSDSTLKSYGISDDFRNAYNVLNYLPGLTEITDAPENTFMMMCNDTPHSPQLLQLPNYTPMLYVDNSSYENSKPSRTDAEGNEIVMTTPVQVQHYHCNMASFLKLGQWFDYLRQNNVYDNTRIIIVSDHGYFLHLKEELEFGRNWDEDILYYNPLLLVKDFGSSAPFATDETFMTNADVPTLVTSGLIENPKNPFTGNPINNQAKDADTFYVFASHQWNTSKNNGNTYLPDPWIALSGDMKDPANWVYINESQLPKN